VPQCGCAAGKAAHASTSRVERRTLCEIHYKAGCFAPASYLPNLKHAGILNQGLFLESVECIVLRKSWTGYAIRCIFLRHQSFTFPRRTRILSSGALNSLFASIERLCATSGAMRGLLSVLSVRSLVLLSAFRHIGALAGPSINVALRASFDSAPYLVELLYVLTQWCAQ
jgi:hypothetical protein